MFEGLTMTIRLENWSCCTDIDDPYMAPELKVILGGLHLQGSVFGHPKFEDGKHVTTSRITDVNGKIVKTRNTEYELGEVNPEFKEFVTKSGAAWDDANPIKRYK
jgi:hypothetical protein